MVHVSSSTARERFARAMRTLRQTKGLSQEDLAERAGLHRNYIGSVERGERNVGIDNLERIAQALETELIDLIGRSD
ncbi:transcriptional regulator [Deinococcus aerophilus]|uniref:Transcriptional regulator n=1 Tax=Deinococcus aerophilus TaxID=522488 RepID=A0ABQ2GWK6_9DEIO|nr:transcriptional regulator [Deinococcus aerophilus]